MTSGQVVTADWVITAALDEPLSDHAVRVFDGLVDQIGPTADLLARYPDDELKTGIGQVLMPGFVNAHIHLYGVLAHGIPMEGTPSGFWPFLEDYWWPKVENALDHDMIAAATNLVSVELLRSGTTSFFDILEAPNSLPEALQVEKDVVDRRGLRAILSFEASERMGSDNGQAGLAENRQLIEACRGDSSSRVSGAMCFHTTFTCPEPFIRQAFEMADELDVFCHAHVNEGVHEGEWCEEHLGVRTLEFYESIGVASPRFQASQCVQMSDREIDIIGETGVRVSHMPLSNCEVGGGIAPVPEYLDRNVTVGLGTDGYINDMYQVMRGAFLLHRARLQDPGALAADMTLHLATEGSARTLGLERVGRLEAGWHADLQLVDAEFPTPVEAHNLAEQLVLWRDHSHVSDVMVAGEWLVENGEVRDGDVAQMQAHAHEQARRLWA